jgi:hypothetical protein
VPDKEENKFARAGLLILEATQTLIDLPFLLISIGIFVIGPHRAKQTCNLYKTKPANEWRGMILNQYLQVIIDIPFILMLIVLCLSVFMALKLKKKVAYRVKEEKVKIEDILRQEIAKHFIKLILVYIIGLALFLILTGIYFATTILIPLRLKQNI